MTISFMLLPSRRLKNHFNDFNNFQRRPTVIEDLNRQYLLSKSKKGI